MTNSKSQINSNFQSQMTERICLGFWPEGGPLKGHHINNISYPGSGAQRAGSLNLVHSCLPVGRGFGA
jgi:hypothetical protein